MPRRMKDLQKEAGPDTEGVRWLRVQMPIRTQRPDLRRETTMMAMKRTKSDTMLGLRPGELQELFRPLNNVETVIEGLVNGVPTKLVRDGVTGTMGLRLLSPAERNLVWIYYHWLAQIYCDC